ncbi:MAG: hypothetical protein ACOX5R_12460 [bacterium]|jgi:hypothetical protein
MMLNIRISLKKLTLWGVFCCLLFMTGCVYLRLLTLKNQLKDFDNHFTTKVDDGFILHFKTPMLYSDDVLYLSKVEPTNRELQPDQEYWTFHFRKERVEESDEGADLIFEMIFDTRKNLMTDFKLSPVFLEIIPPRFLELSLRSLGSAKVDKKNRQLTVAKFQIRKEDMTLPDKEKVLQKLGSPKETHQKEEYTELIYHYKLDQFTPDPKDKERGLAVTTLRFDKQTHELLYARCKFAGLKISIDYSKWKNYLI